MASKTSSQFSGQAQPTVGGTGRKDRIAAWTSQGTLSLHKLTRRQTKNKMTKKKKLHFKVEPFRCQKTGWHYYCLLVFSLEIRESIPLANTRTGPSKMFLFNQIMGVSTNWGFAHGCLFGWGAERDPFWSAVTTVGTLVSARYAWLRRKKLKKEPGKLVTSAI